MLIDFSSSLLSTCAQANCRCVCRARCDSWKGCVQRMALSRSRPVQASHRSSPYRNRKICTGKSQSDLKIWRNDWDQVCAECDRLKLWSSSRAVARFFEPCSEPSCQLCSPISPCKDAIRIRQELVSGGKEAKHQACLYIVTFGRNVPVQKVARLGWVLMHKFVGVRRSEVVVFSAAASALCCGQARGSVGRA